MLPRRNVLVFHSGALGDFVLTWPLAVALGRLFPQSRVFYVTQRQKGLLAERVLRVESVDGEGGWHHLFSESPNLPEPRPTYSPGARGVHVRRRAGQRLDAERRAGRRRSQVVSLSQAAPGDFPATSPITSCSSSSPGRFTSRR